MRITKKPAVNELAFSWIEEKYLVFHSFDYSIYILQTKSIHFLEKRSPYNRGFIDYFVTKVFKPFLNQINSWKIDLPGKKLLGDRQLKFLNDWAVDWKGQDMKIALSQTILANMATRHGADLFRLIADIDSEDGLKQGETKQLMP